ncbi:MAG: Clp1/GlmU family protein [Synechococcus sp.]
MNDCFIELPLNAVTIAERFLSKYERILLYGDMGTGKSTLVAKLARVVADSGRAVFCIGADPGSPAFGVPGAIGLGEWRHDAWQLLELEPVCSLDAVRFRLPIVRAVARLASCVSEGVLLVDAPGVVKGVAGSELLLALTNSIAADAVLMLARQSSATPLVGELGAVPTQVFWAIAAPNARRPNKKTRARARTQLWDEYLAQSTIRDISLEQAHLLGTPPSKALSAAWQGRQVALLRDSQWVAFGEAIALEESILRVRICGEASEANALLVRDAVRRSDGMLVTAKPPKRDASGPQIILGSTVKPWRSFSVQAGPLSATLVNGIFGDPLLQVQLNKTGRSFLFDLGETRLLTRRALHAVTDVFISHAHFDHIAGFLWLLRARMSGRFPACRLYGPPGIGNRIAHLVSGIEWDRIGNEGPEFEVADVCDGYLALTTIKAGCPPHRLGERTISEGLVLQESGLRVRAIALDHGIPVLSFALEIDDRYDIREDRLPWLGLETGPWLEELRVHLQKGEGDASIELPDGRCELVETLSKVLVRRFEPGLKLVYATDLADTLSNRQKAIAHARDAQLLFLEASFVEADRVQAARTQHLTTLACGEIAAAANVERLVPFHFSKRYQQKPELVYGEIRAACGGVALEQMTNSPKVE